MMPFMKAFLQAIDCRNQDILLENLKRIKEVTYLKAEALEAIITGLKEAGINFVASLPSTGIEPIIRGIEADPDLKNDPNFKHVALVNEADGVGICAGAWLGGKVPALMAENTGFLMCTHALMGLAYGFQGFPMLLILDHRGDFGDGIAYFYFGGGRVTPPVLEALGIPYSIVRESNKLKAEIVRGQKTTEAYGKPVAVLLSGEEIW